MLFTVGLALVGLAWLLSTPPWGAPDEPSTLVKGAAIGRGELIGKKPDYQLPAQTSLERWYRELTRQVDIPGALFPEALVPCYAFEPHIDASCVNRAPRGPESLDADARASLTIEPSGVLDARALYARLSVVGPPGHRRLVPVTYLGTYQPGGFVIPGIAASFAGDARKALYVARAVNLLGCLVLVGLGLALLGSRPTVLLSAGLAITPMALFSFASYSSSGPEIAAAFCHIAALLRLRRSDDPPQGLWPILLISGVVLATARSLGPGWVALLDGGFVAMVGGRRCRRKMRLAGRWGSAYVPVILTASATTFIWQWVVQPHPAQHFGMLGTYLSQAWKDLAYQYRQQVGVLGWRDIFLPHDAYRLWTLVLLALLGSALVLSRHRLVLIVQAFVCVSAMLAITVFVASPIGASSQGRWSLPIAMSVPLLAGELTSGASGRTSRLQRWSPALGLGLLAAVHVAALWAAGRRNAVGVEGPAQFLGHGLWSPPLGWEFALLATLGGAFTLVAAGVLAASETGREAVAG